MSNPDGRMQEVFDTMTENVSTDIAVSETIEFLENQIQSSIQRGKMTVDEARISARIARDDESFWLALDANARIEDIKEIVGSVRQIGNMNTTHGLGIHASCTLTSNPVLVTAKGEDDSVGIMLNDSNISSTKDVSKHENGIKILLVVTEDNVVNVGERVRFTLENGAYRSEYTLVDESSGETLQSLEM